MSKLLTSCLLLLIGLLASAQDFSRWAIKEPLARVDSALVYYDREIKRADTTVAEDALLKLLNTAQKEDWPEVECLTYSLLGNKWARVNYKHPKAEANHMKAIAMAKELDLANMQALLLFRYGLYKYSGKDIPQGLVQMLMAEELAQTLPPGSVPYYGEHLYHCGRALYDISDRKRATALIAKGLNFPFQRSYYKLQAYNTLGLCYYRDGLNADAIKCFRQALQVMDPVEDQYWFCLLNKNIGDAYDQQDMTDSALVYYQLAYDGRHSIQDPTLQGGMTFITSLCLARTLGQDVHGKQFEKYLDEAQRHIRYAEGTKYPMQLISLQASWATKQGKTALAQAYWDRYQVISDSTAGLLTQQYYDHTHLLIDTEKALAAVTTQLQQEAFEKEMRGWLLWGFAASLALGGVIFWQQIRHRNTRLSLSQEQLKAAKQTEELAALRAQQAEEAQAKLQELLNLQQALIEAQEREKEAAYRELVAVNTMAAQRKDLIAKIKGAITSYPNLSRQLQALLEKVEDTQSADQEWEHYRLDFMKLHPHFFERLEAQSADLTPYDLRLAAYIKMGLSGKEIARLLNIIEQTLHNSRYRLRKKLGLEAGQDLVTYLTNL